MKNLRKVNRCGKPADFRLHLKGRYGTTRKCYCTQHMKMVCDERVSGLEAISGDALPEPVACDFPVKGE
jgi:hypothetical protein